MLLGVKNCFISEFIFETVNWWTLSHFFKIHFLVSPPGTTGVTISWMMTIMEFYFSCHWDQFKEKNGYSPTGHFNTTKHKYFSFILSITEGRELQFYGFNQWFPSRVPQHIHRGVMWLSQFTGLRFCPMSAKGEAVVVSFGNTGLNSAHCLAYRAPMNAVPETSKNHCLGSFWSCA